MKKPLGRGRELFLQNGIRFHLAALVVVTLLPAVGIGGAVAFQAVRGYQSAFEERLVDTARALGLALDNELEAYQAALIALTTSPLLDSEDLSAFDAWARLVGRQLGTWVVVVSSQPGYPQIINTFVPWGQRLPSGGPDEAFERVFRTGKPTIASLFTGKLTGTPLLGVVYPVIRGGKVVLAVTLPIDPSTLSRLLQAQGLSGQAYASVTDGDGAIIARSRGIEQFLGKKAPDWFMRHVAGPAQPLAQGNTLEGHDVVVAVQELRVAPGWRVGVSEMLDVYREAWQRPLLDLLMGAALAVSAGAAFAAWLAGRILSPVQALMRRAAAIVEGGDALRSPPRVPPAKVAEFEMLRIAIERSETALREEEERSRLAVEAGNLGTWEMDLDKGETIRSAALLKLAGLEQSERMAPHTKWAERIHPEDAGRFLAAITSAFAGMTEVFKVEYRFQRGDGHWRWFASFGAAVAWDSTSGRVRKIAGAVQDITERREAEGHQTLLMREVDHRAKNVLAVVQAALRLTRAADVTSYSMAVQGRVAALARAHTLLAKDHWYGASLRAVIEGELEPFVQPDQKPEPGGPYLTIEGPPVLLSASAAQPISMAIHELATNAVKYGALSSGNGRLAVEWFIDTDAEMLRLRWQERGGPPVIAAPQLRGFGSRVLDGTIRGQLGGTINREWTASGLVCVVDLPLERVAANLVGQRAHVPT